MEPRLQVGIIGAGKMGCLHLKKFQDIPSVDVCGVYDPSEAIAEEVSKRFKVPFSASLPDLLFEADAVVIASPTPTHFSIGKQALEAGLHVLMEKPLATNSLDARELSRTAIERRVQLQVGFLERYRLHALLGDNKVSNVRFVEAERLTDNLGRDPEADVLTDLMIHDLDLVVSLFGEMPSYVSAIGAAVVSSRFDIASVRLDFPSGGAANVSVSRISHAPQRRIRVFSSGGYVSLDLAKDTARWVHRDGSSVGRLSETALTSFDALGAQAREFVEAIRDSRTPRVSAQDGVNALDLAERISKAILERETGTSRLATPKALET